MLAPIRHTVAWRCVGASELCVGVSVLALLGVWCAMGCRIAAFGAVLEIGAVVTGGGVLRAWASGCLAFSSVVAICIRGRNAE